MKFLLYILILCALFFACKRYEHDDHLSLSKPFKRLTKHSWRIIRIEIDGIDSTYRAFSITSQDFDTSYKCTLDLPSVVFANVEFTFEDVVKGESDFAKSYDFKTNSKDLAISLGYNFYNDEEHLGLYFSNPTKYCRDYLPCNDLWKIEKLTKKDLWISNDKYRFNKRILIKFEK